MAGGSSIDGGGARPAPRPARAPTTERPRPKDTARPPDAAARPAVAAPADAIAIGQARHRIAAVLSRVDTRPADLVPLPPGAGDAAISSARRWRS